MSRQDLLIRILCVYFPGHQVILALPAFMFRQQQCATVCCLRAVVHGLAGPECQTNELSILLLQWLRDSAVQAAIYFPRVRQFPSLRILLEGVIRTQAYFVLQVLPAVALWPMVAPMELNFRKLRKARDTCAFVSPPSMCIRFLRC